VTLTDVNVLVYAYREDARQHRAYRGWLEGYVSVEPGPRHWEIFTRLCREAEARGNLVADAFLAALAIESGSEWITTDRDYGRFPRPPLAPSARHVLKPRWSLVLTAS
jgi:predicted nucleic acid-binding protein